MFPNAVWLWFNAVFEGGTQTSWFLKSLVNKQKCLLQYILEKLRKRKERGYFLVFLINTTEKIANVVIALSCMAGFGGIKSAIPDAKVVHGMTTLGTLAAYLTTKNGKIYIDKSKSRIVRFRENDKTT